MTSPIPPHQRPDPTPPGQTWQQLPPHIQIPAQRQAPPLHPAIPAPPEPRTALKVTLGAVGGLILGIAIGAIGSAGGSAGTSTQATRTPQAVLQTKQAPAAPALPAGPVTTFSDGIYEIGADVVPGKYKTPGPGNTSIVNSCYLEVGNGSGRVEGIVQNDNLTGPGVVMLPEGKVFKVQGGCIWTKVG